MENTNKQAQEVDKEVQEVSNAAIALNFILKKTAEIVFGIFRGIFYIIYLTLNLISDLIEKGVFFDWQWFNEKYYESEEVEEKEEMYKIQIVSNGTKHEYIMNRGKEFDKLYAGFLGKVEVTKDRSITLSQDVSKDIIQKVDRMVFLVEKNAIQEGYRFGRNSRSDVDEEEIYNEYITEQVKKGR